MSDGTIFRQVRVTRDDELFQKTWDRRGEALSIFNKVMDGPITKAERAILDSWLDDQGTANG